MPLLSVNIDHVATIRQARYRDAVASGYTGPAPMIEPDPVRAAHEAELGGADGVTVHLREDRRHIVDRDVRLLRELLGVRMNLEMAATDEMVRIALDVRPHTCMLVPEGRHEVTTEGGLDVAGARSRLGEIVSELKSAGMVVSAFVDADAAQIEAAAEAGFDVCEVHTGPYAHAFAACGGDFSRSTLRDELAKVADAGHRIRTGSANGRAAMRFNAGHALNYHNVGPIAVLPGVSELHIGHAIVSRAVFIGLRGAVREMKRLVSAAGSAGLDGPGEM